MTSERAEKIKGDISAYRFANIPEPQNKDRIIVCIDPYIRTRHKRSMRAIIDDGARRFCRRTKKGDIDFKP